MRWTSDGVCHSSPVFVDREARTVAVAIGGSTETFTVVVGGPGLGSDAPGGSAAAVRAPFPAVVTEVHVKAGDSVRAGEVVIVVEAMKILHSLAANGDGVVAAVHVAPGDQVASRDVLISFEEPS